MVSEPTSSSSSGARLAAAAGRSCDAVADGLLHALAGEPVAQVGVLLEDPADVVHRVLRASRVAGRPGPARAASG
jgi:hypothetical protein